MAGFDLPDAASIFSRAKSLFPSKGVRRGGFVLPTNVVGNTPVIGDTEDHGGGGSDLLFSSSVTTGSVRPGNTSVSVTPVVAAAALGGAVSAAAAAAKKKKETAAKKKIADAAKASKSTAQAGPRAITSPSLESAIIAARAPSITEQAVPDAAYTTIQDYKTGWNPWSAHSSFKPEQTVGEITSQDYKTGWNPWSGHETQAKPEPAKPPIVPPTPTPIDPGPQEPTKPSTPKGLASIATLPSPTAQVWVPRVY
jgi:hypothetical protein